MMRALKKIVNTILNRKKDQPVYNPIYKTRSQIIAEGRGACICRQIKK
jgi:hypothetical protein